MKLTLGLLIAAQLFTMPAATVGVVAFENPDFTVSYETGKEEEPTRQEVFKWYYRIHEGHQQKRLWSVTYGYWVTDWIDC